MISCDAYYISKLIPGITYNDVICSMGLSNGIFFMNYDQNDIYMMKSRYVTSQLQLLDRLRISYKLRQIEDLFDETVPLERVLVFLPKILLDNIAELHQDTRQLALSISSFGVRRKDAVTLILSGMDPDETEYEREVSRQELEKLSHFEMKPSIDSLVIVELGDACCNQDIIRKNICESMEHCLSDYKGIDNGELLWYGGKSAYQKLYDVICRFDELDETARKVLVGTMVSGSNFFYRKEYWEALKEYAQLDSRELNELRVAGGLWRKVIRTLVNHVCFQQKLNLVEMENVIMRIEITELHSFSYIKNTI